MSLDRVRRTHSKAPSSVVDGDYVVVTRSMSSLRRSCSWSVGRAADELDGYTKHHSHAALYDVLAAPDETHLGLDTAQGRVELQQVIPLVNAKTEWQTEDNRCHYPSADRERPREG